MFLGLLRELINVGSRVEDSVISEVLHQSSVSLRNTEGVQLPTDFWCFDANLIDKESVSSHKVVDDIIISRAGLIWGRPTTVHDGQLAGADEIPNTILLFGSLIIPPHLEEFHFSICERSLGVLLERMNRRGEDIVDRSKVEDIASSIKVVVDGIKPSEIVMGVWNNMHRLLLAVILHLEVVAGRVMLVRVLHVPNIWLEGGGGVHSEINSFLLLLLMELGILVGAQRGVDIGSFVSQVQLEHFFLPLLNGHSGVSLIMDLNTLYLVDRIEC